jgi:hypothetical protein
VSVAAALPGADLLPHNGSSDDNPASETPRVFLSYSHDSDAHKAWVRQLAERLREGGVEVTLDQWDLPLGADVVRFMELGIRDADRVLMVCTANYVAKAEERKGGAGNETMIVTGHVVGATDTIKFVPIVRDHAGEPLVPAFLGQRRWLDFRDDGLFEERLEELLRELHGAPRYPKPPLGRNPFAGPELEGGAKDQQATTPSPGPSRGSRETAGERQEAGAQQEAGVQQGDKVPSASAAEGNPAAVFAPPATPALPITPAAAAAKPPLQASSIYSSEFTYPELTNQVLEKNGKKERNIFLMIPFARKDKYENVRRVIRSVLDEFKYTLVAADDRTISENLSVNLTAHMDACKLAIAVIDSVPLNSNIAFELGYLKRSSTQCLMLKDKTITVMPAAIRGLLYESVDFDQINATIPKAVRKWLANIDS